MSDEMLDNISDFTHSVSNFTRKLDMKIRHETIDICNFMCYYIYNGIADSGYFN